MSGNCHRKCPENVQVPEKCENCNIPDAEILKKTDYPKSYRARHALSVIHNNNGFVKLQRTVRTAGNLVGFSDQDEKILFNIWKQREQKKEPVNLSKKKYVNGLCALCGYLRKHNLSNHIPNVQYHEQSTSKSSTERSNTLTILKTGGGKSLIYAVASVLS
ncbi:hypothetical protein RhiirA5_428950 [Rhizophagus irregularis]|uniref:Uncharacterized protein n=1 Tax=Rhizophagus irregularis TaxID=588596 RepID=A0A2I1EV60_9GLOM|nr:hypothetical protein RhiirA5_428950 [Rhizophagus irregularis]PKC65210.1 hypothetical protein RhiirA1_461335 [Rhizophagus irregularis]PKY25998.1 hypothetical protein RhiirB3_441150 [Rhizophagus irregularis]